MWNQFLLQNAHFAFGLFTALVFFAVFWLYFDAWLEKKSFKEAIKIMGFFLVSLSFLVYAVTVESTLLSSVVGGQSSLLAFQYGLKVIGFLCIIVGLLQEKLEARPNVAIAVGVPISLTPLVWMQLASPVLALVITLLYLRKSIWGLEAHVRRVGIAFFFLTVSELLALASLLRETSTIDVYKLVAPFGSLWIAQHVVLLIASLLLGKWVFGYLLKQFQPQLFFILNALILLIFLITTVSFTGLLLKNIQDETTAQLDSDVKVLEFAIGSKNAGHKSDALLIASDPQLVAAFVARDRNKLNVLAQNYLITKKYSFLAIVNTNGQVISRGEDAEKIGDSLKTNPLIKRVLRGESASGLESKDGVLAPQLFVSGASAIESDGKVIGAVILGTGIDNAFVDEIHTATGLESSIYGGNIISATTLISSDGKSRLIGLKEETNQVKKNVLENGRAFATSVTIANRPYFASYVPLVDIDGTALGMVSVEKTQDGVLQAAGRSIEYTFLFAAGLLIISVLPAYLIARYMAAQL